MPNLTKLGFYFLKNILKTLILIRHAKSSWEYTLADHDRPLNEKGKLDSKQLSSIYSDKIIGFDQMYCSTAVRATSTLQNLLQNKVSVSVNYDKKWYQFDYRIVLQQIKQLPTHFDKVVLVGHNPAYHDLVEIITEQSFENFPTCALAEIQLNITDWKDLNKGELLTFFTPKTLLK